MFQKAFRKPPVIHRVFKPSWQTNRQWPVRKSFHQFLILQGGRRLAWKSVCDLSSPIWHSWKMNDVQHTAQVGTYHVSSSYEDRSWYVPFRWSVSLEPKEGAWSSRSFQAWWSCPRTWLLFRLLPPVWIFFFSDLFLLIKESIGGL